MPHPLPRALTAGAAAAAAGMVLVLAACGGGADAEPAAADAGSPAQVDVVHAQGETTVPVDPETVVVFDVGVLSTLDSLGVEVAGVPDAAYPQALSRFAGDDVPKVGSLFEPDLEAVNALEPDLVIVAGRSSEALPALSDIAPTVDLSVDSAEFLPSFRERTETLGEIFGQEEEVAERLDAIDEQATATREAAADAGSGLVVMTSGAEVSVYGAGSRFGIVHDALGVTPADPDIAEADHGDAVSFEYIAERDPDLLYVIDRDAAIGEGGEAAEQVLDNELVAGTTAWQQGDVVYLDPFTWYIAPNGLPSVESMVDAVSASLT